MSFLHDGRPAVVREATWTPPEDRPVSLPAPRDFTADLIDACFHTGMYAARNGSSASMTMRSRPGR